MLKFNENGKFRILCFGDLHVNYENKDMSSAAFRDMIKLANAALDEYKPDLCVYMGDVCSTSNAESPTFKEELSEALMNITEPVRSRRIPYASIFGNHEHDHGGEEDIVDVYSKLPGCLMRNDAGKEVSGWAHYNEPIYSSDGEKILFNLWFMDSNNLHSDRSVSHYDWVHEDQIKWYEAKAGELAEKNGGKPVPAILFQHIPVVQEYALCRKANLWEIPCAVRGENTRSKTFYVLKDGVKGYMGEGPCSPDIDRGQFKSWKKTGDIIGAVFGHDHMNDFDGYVNGIRLMQCKTAGFGAYTDGCRSGVRIIELDASDLKGFSTQMKHFKEFGLKCESLGPVEKRITDRQSINLTITSRVLIPAACLGAAAAAVRKIKNNQDK